MKQIKILMAVVNGENKMRGLGMCIFYRNQHGQYII